MNLYQTVFLPSANNHPDNNIAFGCNHQVTREEIEQAAIAANVMVFANNMASGLESQIGENGRRLSGSQRIAIALAILWNTETIILDEATSALDNESEKHVQAAFAQLAQNKMMIIIAHQLTTITNADNILVMADGKLIEQGTHEQLLNSKGYYQALQQG